MVPAPRRVEPERSARERNGSRTAALRGARALLAIGLGMVLVPLRGVTSASNFSFAFLALTIVVAEYAAGPPRSRPVAAALSLDFFLTQPYLRLEIADKHTSSPSRPAPAA